MLKDIHDSKPTSFTACKQREAIQIELYSLNKRKVFGLIVKTPNGVKRVGYKWVFIRKYNERNEIQCYKTRLAVQDFSQRSNIDYEETSSLVMYLLYFVTWLVW